MPEDTPYNYQVQAFDLANNKSAQSETLSTQTARSSPYAPTNLVATAVSAAEVALTWSPPQNNSGLSEYLVYAGTSITNLQQAGSTEATATACRVRSLNPNTVYYFSVAAVESGVTSPMSPVSRVPTFPLPTPPTSVSAAPSGNTDIILNWQEDLARGGLPVIGYDILRGTTSGNLTKFAYVTRTTFTNRNLNSGTTYYYEIVAVDSEKDSSQPSSEVSATTP